MLLRLFSRNTTFRNELRNSFVQIVFWAVFPLGAIGIFSEYLEYTRDKQIIYNDFAALRKESAKEHVQHWVRELETIEAEFDEQILYVCQQNISLLHTIFQNISASASTELSRQQLLLRMLKNRPDTLLMASYFVLRTDGYCLLNDFLPSLQNTNVSTERDALGNESYARILEALKINEDGIVSFYWDNDNEKEFADEYKLYFRKVHNTNLIVGQVVSVQHYRKLKQTEVLDKIAAYRFGTSGYLFVNTLDGKIWITNGSRNEIPRIFVETDTMRWNIFTEQKRILQEEGGGFIQYNWNKLDSTTRKQKVSYINSFLKWNWIIGAGIYLEDVELTVLKKQKSALYALVIRTLVNVATLVLVFVFVLLWANKMSSRMTRILQQFQNFFSHKKDLHQPIQADQIPYVEFQSLARYTNAMVEQMNKAYGETNREKIYFERLFQHAPEGIAITGKSLIIKRVNDKFEDLFGYTSTEILSKTTSVLTPYRFLEEDEEIYRETAKGLSVAIVSTERLRKDGKIVHVSIFATPVFHEGKYFATYLTFRNNTDKIETQNQLTESKNLLHSFFYNATEGFCIFQFDKVFDWKQVPNKKEFVKQQLHHLRLVQVNALIDLFWNIENDSKLYQPLTTLFRNRLPKIEKWMLLLLKQGQVDLHFHTTYNGKLVWVHGQFNTFLDTENNVKGVFGILNDITERRQHEKELRQQKQKAEQADALKTAFLSNMSHEIRTPMNAITGFADLLSEPDLNEADRKEFIEQINTNSNTLLRLIDDIVDVSKMEANQLDFNFEQVHLPLLFANIERNILIVIKKLYPEKELIVELKTASSIHAIVTDSVRLQQIIMNLLLNAIKFTDNGTITFGYQQHNNIANTLEFYVRDTGIGIPKNKQQIIFDRFVSIDHPTKGNLGGAGLGLSIANTLVQRLGGILEVESEVNKGSSFFYSLKLQKTTKTTLQTEELKPQELKQAQPQQKEQTNNSIKPTVLLAEDNTINYKLFAKMIEPTKVPLLRAANGQEAIDLVNEHPEISLVFMDVQMPVLNGKDATRQIKAKHPDLPIIAQTAYTLETEHNELLEAGCTKVINKPIKRQEIIALIEHYLSL